MRTEPLKTSHNGVQDCGKPHYLANYRSFYAALKTAHPSLRLISNCDMKTDAQQDLYDWHLYSSAHLSVCLTEA